MDQDSSFRILISEPTLSFDDKVPYKSPIAAHLEDVADRIVKHIANKDFSNPDFEEYLAPDYHAYLPHSQQPYSRSLKDLLDNYQVHATTFPEYHIEALNLSADVNEKNGTATVWMLLRVTGAPTSVQRESVTVVYFRRKRGGKWVAFKQTGIRGIMQP